MRTPYQKGFTLIEILIAMTIVSIMVVGSMAVLGGGDETKTTAVMSKAEEYANALAIYKRNTGCVPNILAVLFDPTQATAANNFCGQNTTASYGPNNDYTKPMPVDATNRVMLDGMGVSGATVSVYRDGIGPYNYMLKFEQLTAPMVQNLVVKCNGISTSSALSTAIADPISNINLDLTHYTCRGDTVTGEVDYRFDKF